MPLSQKTKAPAFTALADDGSTIRLSSFKEKNVVLFFYPKDDTSGCTAEACDFRDNIQRVTAHDAVVIGISPDSVKSHIKFKNKYDLNFMLLSDEDKSICTKYEVWVEKSMYGRKYMGVERTTYIIDAKGRIKTVFANVKVNGHVDAVIEELGEL